MTAQQQLPATFANAGFADLDVELASTRKVLERFPEGKNSWQPHIKSRQIAQLASHLAQLPWLGMTILEKDHFDVMAPRQRPEAQTSAELVALFDDVCAKLRSAIAKTSAEKLSEPWSLRAGDKVFVTAPKRVALRTVFLSHLIHHRAQLTVYYRLLDVPVPGLYGPTADEPI
jgi:uncharacterized damage-inducible protein DinB